MSAARVRLRARFAFPFPLPPTPLPPPDPVTGPRRSSPRPGRSHGPALRFHTCILRSLSKCTEHPPNVGLAFSGALLNTHADAAPPSPPGPGFSLGSLRPPAQSHRFLPPLADQRGSAPGRVRRVGGGRPARFQCGGGAPHPSGAGAGRGPFASSQPTAPPARSLSPLGRVNCFRSVQSTPNHAPQIYRLSILFTARTLLGYGGETRATRQPALPCRVRRRALPRLPLKQ